MLQEGLMPAFSKMLFTRKVSINGVSLFFQCCIQKQTVCYGNRIRDTYVSKLKRSRSMRTVLKKRKGELMFSTQPAHVPCLSHSSFLTKAMRDPN